MKTKEALFNYIKSSTNWQLQERELDIALPLYLKSSYDLYFVSLENLNIVFAKVLGTSLDMRMHYNAIKKLEELCNYHVVLVFETLKSNTITSMIAKQIPFIILDSQIFLPFALVEIQTKKTITPLKKAQKLTPNAELILIGYLDNQAQSGMMIKEIATLIDTELRATSTALSLLESLEYISIKKEGISKKIYFISQQDVYEKLNENQLSPLKYIFFTKNRYEKIAIKSGYSALAQFSNLMDDAIKTFAIHKKNLNFKQWQTMACEPEDAKYKVEVWDRNPSVFSKEGSVHPLYILKLLKHSNDERTIEALKGLEKKLLDNFKGEPDLGHKNPTNAFIVGFKF